MTRQQARNLLEDYTRLLISREWALNADPKDEEHIARLNTSLTWLLEQKILPAMCGAVKKRRRIVQ